MLVPYSTDAPIYHFPFTTIGLILANIGAFVLTVGDPSIADTYVLEFGRIAPWQWVTTNFLHAGLGHLLGNLIFLWAFSLIVEGKIGWWRYLLLYLTIGVLYGALVQIGMFILSDRSGAALGASGVIYGIVAVAVCWAPRNEISCFYWFLGPRTVDVPVSALGFFYFAIQMLFLGLQQFRMSSELLHMTGIVVGLPIGLLMLHLEWVDAEGHDLLSEIRGQRGQRKRKSLDLATERKMQEERIEQQRQTVIRSIEAAVESENWAVATSLVEKHAGLFSTENPVPSFLLVRAIRGLHAAKEWKRSIPLMTKLLEWSPVPQPSVQLRLAQIYLQVCNRPIRAIRLLESLPDDLPEKQQQMKQKLLAMANRALDDGEIEFAD